ncbi:MAG: DUF6311 domain-containing protein [bacterium]
MFTKKQKQIISIIIASCIAATFFLFLYSEILNPKYDAWLLTSSADPAQHYMGWMMYKNSNWSFPLGVAKNYAYPIGLPITFTDSIPLFAIIFKLFRHFMQGGFQYFGIWLLVCFMMQSVFGYLLIKIFIDSETIAILGSTLFILSPIMLFNNFALAGHWLILWGIWLIFKKHNSLQGWQWGLLFLLSLFTHPYIFFMNGFLMLTDVGMLFYVNKKIGAKQIFIFFASEIIWVLLLSYSLGIFIGQSHKGGYGSFSMNLITLFNPADGWSKLLPYFPIGQYQLEGFNYLGAGILLLFVLSLSLALRKKKLYLIFKKYWPLLLICLILSMLAISNVITFSNIELINIKLPLYITNNLLGTIQASGRMFWPVFYIILLFSFYILKKSKFKITLFILIAAIALQYFDLSGKLNQLDNLFEKKIWSNPIDTKEWREYSKDYEHIFFLPVIPDINYASFTLYAAENNLTVNNGYFARSIKKLDKNIEEKIKDAKNGNYNCDTIYIFSRDIEYFYPNMDLKKHLLTPIYKAHILYPCYKQKHPETNFSAIIP